MIPYKKNTKDNTKIAPLILFFINELNQQIEARGGLGLHDMAFLVKSKEVKYCYDAIRLVEKTYKRKKIICKMSSYNNKIEEKTHQYVWKMKLEQ